MSLQTRVSAFACRTSEETWLPAGAHLLGGVSHSARDAAYKSFIMLVLDGRSLPRRAIYTGGELDGSRDRITEALCLRVQFQWAFEHCAPGPFVGLDLIRSGLRRG